MHRPLHPDYRPLTARYPGQCASCGQTIRVNAPIAWRPGTNKSPRLYHLNHAPLAVTTQLGTS